MIRGCTPRMLDKQGRDERATYDAHSTRTVSDRDCGRQQILAGANRKVILHFRPPSTARAKETRKKKKKRGGWYLDIECSRTHVSLRGEWQSPFLRPVSVAGRICARPFGDSLRLRHGPHARRLRALPINIPAPQVSPSTLLTVAPQQPTH
jgi:hypothetical protein